MRRITDNEKYDASDHLSKIRSICVRLQVCCLAAVRFASLISMYSSHALTRRHHGLLSLSGLEREYDAILSDVSTSSFKENSVLHLAMLWMCS